MTSKPTVHYDRPVDTWIVTFYFDFQLSDTLPVDLSPFMECKGIDLRSFFVDLAKTSSVMGLISPVSQQPLIQVNGRTAGYYPCFFDAPARFQITFNGASDINPLPVQFYSKPKFGPVWGFTA